jgi:hypothetical protein
MSDECSLFLPIRLPSVANMREHWAKKARRVKEQRSTVAMVLRTALSQPTLPAVIDLVRISPRQLDDDNLQSAFKAVRDGVADWLGVDDADEQVTWRYAQKRRGSDRGIQILVRECDGG